MIAPNESIMAEDSPVEGATAGEDQKNLNKNASCSSDEAAGISCLELEAWIKDDDSMDCMMLLPEVPLDEDSPSSGSMQECDTQQLHSPSSNNLCCGDEQCLSHEASIFCRSSSSCSSTFPDVDTRQETLELSLPDDFFDEKHHSAVMSQDQEMSLPPLSDPHRGNSSNTSSPRGCDLKKIIVKKPVMDKAVERLGGGRRGALRLWNIIQVWLRYQQQGISPPALDGFLMQGSDFLGLEQHQQQNNNQQVFGVAPGFGSNAWDPGMISQQQQQQQPQVGYPELDNHHPGGFSGSCPSSAATTRAARKSRMARQRRHRAGNGGAGAGAAGSNMVSSGPPAAWSSSSSLVSGSIRSLELQPQQQFSASRDKEKPSIKFLLQKELKPSDVGNLGRIVLPKKEAEVHLPYLTLREGITLAMEDMVTTQVWHFRYRFWPNNKSRMYLLEGTGEFIRSHQLKEGDMLQIYRDCKSGKHMIFGKKVLKPKKPAPPPEDHQLQQQKPDDDCLSGVSTISDDAPELRDNLRQLHQFQELEEHQQHKRGDDSPVEIEKFPSVELGDEFIDEILGMVEGEEAESCKEDNI